MPEHPSMNNVFQSKKKDASFEDLDDSMKEVQDLWKVYQGASGKAAIVDALHNLALALHNFHGTIGSFLRYQRNNQQ